MSSWVDGHRVCVRNSQFTKRLYSRSVQPEGRNDSTFRRDIQTSPHRIPREYVGRIADLVLSDHPHRAKVDGLQLRVVLRGYKGESIRLGDRKPMRMVRTRKIIPLNDLLTYRVDRDELIPRLHGNENAM